MWLKNVCREPFAVGGGRLCYVLCFMC